MRKLVSLVCVTLIIGGSAYAGVIPSWDSPSGQIGFHPITNELAYYHNVDDAGVDRGSTLQLVSINGFRLWTDFSFEVTGDYNFSYTPGLDRDHYFELSLVKPLTSFVSLNYQRVLSTFEPDPINQLGVRLSF